jgi:hypothetical protein
MEHLHQKAVGFQSKQLRTELCVDVLVEIDFVGLSGFPLKKFLVVLSSCYPVFALLNGFFNAVLL